MYVNGVPGNDGNVADNGYDLVRSRNWHIGTGGDGPFPGIMDEVRLFGSALSGSDITGWMNASAPDLTPLGWII